MGEKKGGNEPIFGGDCRGSLEYERVIQAQGEALDRAAMMRDGVVREVVGEEVQIWLAKHPNVLAGSLAEGIREAVTGWLARNEERIIERVARARSGDSMSMRIETGKVEAGEYAPGDEVKVVPDPREPAGVMTAEMLGDMVRVMSACAEVMGRLNDILDGKAKQ